MNYTSAAIGVIGLISIVVSLEIFQAEESERAADIVQTWTTTGRKAFTGPQIAAENGNIIPEYSEKEREESESDNGRDISEKI